jgi:hypothetical protein
VTAQQTLRRVGQKEDENRHVDLSTQGNKTAYEETLRASQLVERQSIETRLE